jgi:hypothetical protein
MQLASMVPVEYRGELVALVSRRRIHIVAPWLLQRPAGDAELRFIAFMCAYAGQVLAGTIAGPFSSELAELWTRRALIDDRHASALAQTSEEEAATALNVPIDQLRRVRDLLGASGSASTK